MASTWFQNGQRIIVQILDWLQVTASNYTGARIEDYSESGICKFEFSEFAVTPGSNNTPTTPSVSVGSGVAWDFNNQRVLVYDTNTFNASNPTDTTNDGTGNFVSTPQSTGSQNIPLTVNSQNYVWIQYLVTVDTTQYTLQDITLAKQFYKFTDGYQFIVTTVNVAPSITSIFIAGINLTGSGVVSSTTISQLGRVYTGNAPYRNYIQTVATNLSDRTTIYTTGNEQYFLDDHIKAVGTGTVGPMNPHGLSPQDIGLNGASTLQFHQEFLHSPGIVGVSSTVQAQIVNITPGFDQLLVNPIPVNSVVTSNGISLTSTDIPVTTTLQFTSSDAPGTWYVYVDIINKLISRTQTNLIAIPNPNQYLIYTVLYTFPDPDSSNGHLSALTDFRVFGNIATRELQAGSVTGIKINPSTLGAGLSKDGSNDIQVNVDGTSIIINGSNELVATSAGLAGAGLIEVGSVLSVNPDNSTINIVSNKVEVANNGITSLQINPSAIGTGLTGGGGVAISIVNGGVNGSTSNTGSQQQIRQGTVSTPDLRANAVTQIVVNQSSAANAGVSPGLLTITTTSITTIGGAIQVSINYNALLTHSSGSTSAQLRLLRNGSPIYFWPELVGAGFQTGGGFYCAGTSFIDSVVAGTYVYSLQLAFQGFGIGAGGTSYNLQAIELRR